MSGHKTDTILTLNIGSSTLKYALFSCHKPVTELQRGQLSVPATAEYAVCELVEKLQQQHPDYNLIAIGHRLVHGGTEFTQATLIRDNVLAALEALIPLAPMHLPAELNAIKALQTQFPDMLQIACFDTAFHAHQPRLAKLFALPRHLTDEGILRYGFHGLSYAYIASMLENVLPENKQQRVVVAHLGNGASLCALKDKHSVATTMGFTALDGLMMGTRSGSLDAGVVLYLAQQKQMSLDEISDVLYKQSGLLGVSGISADMRELEQDTSEQALEARQLFAYRAAREVSSLTAALGGLDAIVFTGGIGEHSAATRADIIRYCAHFGARLNSAANKAALPLIHHADSSVAIAVIPTNEEHMIATDSATLISQHRL